MNEPSIENNIDHGIEWKISQTRCSGYREAITARIESIKRQDKEACTGVICNRKSYELVLFYSRTMLTKWNHYKFEVRVDNK